MNQLFKVEIKAITGEEWELPYTQFTFTEELNNESNATITVEYEVIKDIADNYGVTVEFILSATFRELYIYDENDNLIYGGYISELEFSANENEISTIAISSKGYVALLDRRYTDDGTLTDETSTDASDIAWNLINYTQGLSYGDFGITRGATGKPTKNRDRTFRYDNIGEELRKLSNNNVKDGFDFEITPSKIFNVYYPEKGTQQTNIILEEGFNIHSFTMVKTFINVMANQAIVLGAGLGTAQNVVIRDAEAEYKTSFYLLQEALTETGIEQTVNLEDKGDKYLDRYKFPSKLIQSLVTDYDEPDYLSYSLGDRLKVKIPSLEVNDYYRVYKRTVKHDKTVILEFQVI